MASHSRAPETPFPMNRIRQRNFCGKEEGTSLSPYNRGGMSRANQPLETESYKIGFGGERHRNVIVPLTFPNIDLFMNSKGEIKQPNRLRQPYDNNCVKGALPRNRSDIYGSVARYRVREEHIQPVDGSAQGKVFKDTVDLFESDDHRFQLKSSVSADTVCQYLAYVPDERLTVDGTVQCSFNGDSNKSNTEVLERSSNNRTRAQTVQGVTRTTSSNSDPCSSTPSDPSFSFASSVLNRHERRSVTFSPVLAEVEFFPDDFQSKASRQGDWGVAPFNDEYWDGEKRKFREKPLTTEELESENSRFTTMLKDIASFYGFSDIDRDSLLERINVINPFKWTLNFGSLFSQYEKVNTKEQEQRCTDNDSCISKAIKNNLGFFDSRLTRNVRSAFSTAAKS